MRRCLGIGIVSAALLLVGCDWFVSADQRIARADQRVAAGDDRGALIELQNAVQSEPENIAARLKLTAISLRLGDPLSARKELAQAVKAGATSAQSAPLAARTYLAAGEFKQLLDALDAHELVLEEPALSTFRGRALMGLNQRDAAVAAFEQALKADPSSADAQVALAEALAVSGRSDDALRRLDAVLKADPGNASALLLKGVIQSRLGDFKGAVLALDAARQHAAGKLSASERLAATSTLVEAQLGVGDPARAEAVYAELAKAAPQSPVTQLLAARIAMVRQDYTTAVAEAQRAVAAAPQLLPAKLLLGAALLAQGNLNQAQTQLEDVIQLAPANVPARKLLARVNLQRQRPDLATQVLLPARQGDEADPELDALLGWADLQRGDSSAGIALLEKSLAARPANQALKLDLAAAYLGSGQAGKAVQLLQSVPAVTGSTRRESLLIAALGASKGPAAARVEIDRMVAASPRDAALLDLAAQFHARAGELDRARELFDRAAALQPGNAALLLNRARLDVLAGDAEAAIKQLETLRAKDPAAVDARLLLARLYLQQKSPQADEVIRELQAQAADRSVVASALGRLLLDAGRYEPALAAFRSTLEQEPTNREFQLNVARAQMAMGNAAPARETLTKLLATNANWVPASVDLILIDYRDGRRDAATSRLAALKAAHPDEPAVAVLEGDMAMASKSYAAAAEAYATAYKLAPTGVSALRAYRARQLGKLPGATALLEAWLQRQPGDVSARMALAEAFMAAGQNDQAIAQYERIAAGASPPPVALNNLAWLYHQKADPRATAMAKAAHDAAPGVAAIADTYGWILVAGGAVKEGLPILKQAAIDSKQQPDIRYHYAAALAKAGQREEARRELQALAEAGSDYSGAAEARKLLAELGG
jgi:predicted Zn-dependent protease